MKILSFTLQMYIFYHEIICLSKSKTVDIIPRGCYDFFILDEAFCITHFRFAKQFFSYNN